MMDIEVGEATIKDINNNLLKLYIDGFRLHQQNRPDIFKNLIEEELKQSLIEKLNNENEKFLVVKDDKKIIGYLLYKIKEKKLKLFGLMNLLLIKILEDMDLGKC